MTTESLHIHYVQRHNTNIQKTTDVLDVFANVLSRVEQLTNILNEEGD